MLTKSSAVKNEEVAGFYTVPTIWVTVAAECGPEQKKREQAVCRRLDLVRPASGIFFFSGNLETHGLKADILRLTRYEAFPL